MDFNLKEKIEYIDNLLHDFCNNTNNPQSKIYEAMEYSLFAGGKRLRPILMIEIYKMFKNDMHDIIPFACAIEMIHTYSLIHDDLPAMDNDDLRRGMPTNHIKFGEATAILAGDALLNKAFEVVSEYNYSNTAPKTVLKAINLLAVSSGTEGMIGGQVVDILSEGKNITLDELKYIHSLKTGAIIRSACIIGAFMGGANEIELKAIDTFALMLGIAFQIQDDILDVIGDEKKLGKPIGSDKKLQKNTYTSLCGIEKSIELSKEYSKKAIDALELFNEKKEFLVQFTKKLTVREN